MHNFDIEVIDIDQPHSDVNSLTLTSFQLHLNCSVPMFSLDSSSLWNLPTCTSYFRCCRNMSGPRSQHISRNTPVMKQKRSTRTWLKSAATWLRCWKCHCNSTRAWKRGHTVGLGKEIKKIHNYLLNYLDVFTMLFTFLFISACLCTAMVSQNPSMNML